MLVRIWVASNVFANSRANAIIAVEGVLHSITAPKNRAMTIDLMRLFVDAQAFHKAGKSGDARAHYEKILAADPNHGAALHMLGLMAFQTGQPELAATLLAKAVRADPEVPSLHSNLGLALQALGLLTDAVASFHHALALAPQMAETHNNLGLALLAQGQVKEAAASFARAVALNGELADAHANLGDALWSLGNLEEAEAAHVNAMRLRPHNADSLAALGILALARGDGTVALQRMQQVLTLEETPRTQRLFADVAQFVRWDGDDPALRALLTRAIAEGWGRPATLAQAASGLIRLRLAGGGRIEDDMLLRAVLCATPNSDLVLEAALTKARRDILARALAEDHRDADFAVALAQQCFLNEYVFWQEADEEAKVASLQAQIESMLAAGTAIAPPLLTALACYVPLGTVESIETLATPTDAGVAALLRQQRDEPREEKRAAIAVPVLTQISDHVSDAVRRQYEDNPYPRWAKLPKAGKKSTLCAYLGSRFPFVGLKQVGPTPSLLVAGCGTGQSVLELVQDFVVSDVTAIDLSRASLGHAARKAQEAGAQIRFGQGDILHVSELGRQYSLIDCSGVLHHMADPFAGWLALLKLLPPDGIMRVALYSRVARQDIAVARGLIGQQAFAPTPRSIRACRRWLARERPDLHAVLDSPDFFSVSGCRDLLFHVQEHVYALPDIASFLRDHDLIFIGFDLSEPALTAYHARFPDDPAATNFDHWTAMEADQPSLFAGMYQFWLRRP